MHESTSIRGWSPIPQPVVLAGAATLCRPGCCGQRRTRVVGGGDLAYRGNRVAGILLDSFLHRDAVETVILTDGKLEGQS